MSDPQRTASPNSYVVWLDYARLLAALSVLAFHYVVLAPRAGAVPDGYVPLLSDLAAYGYLGVELFFLISGFVILQTASRGTGGISSCPASSACGRRSCCA